MMFKTRVVFPDASGPKISVTRPLGTPPIPRAISKPKEPVEIAATLPAWEAICSPSFIIEPRPKDFSICSIADSNARVFPEEGVSVSLEEAFGILLMVIPLGEKSKKKDGSLPACRQARREPIFFASLKSNPCLL